MRELSPGVGEVTWEQRSCFHCEGAGLTAGRTGGQAKVGGKEERGDLGQELFGAPPLCS